MYSLNRQRDDSDHGAMEKRKNQSAGPVLIPEMLVLARESRGLTQAELALRLGVTQSKVSRFEDGLADVSDEIVNKLQDVLGYPAEFYMRDAEREGARPTFYRKYASLPKPILRRVVAKLNVVKLQLEKMLSASEPISAPFPRWDPSEHVGGASGVAALVRTNLRIPDGPIRNLVRRVEQAGCVVFEIDFGTRKIDGCGDFVGDVPVVFVNAQSSAARARFTIAHEIGHLIMHEIPDEHSEEEAHEFASELLMPEDELKSMLLPVNLDRLARLKLHWGVSMQAILKRAQDMRVISERSARYQWMLMSKAGYRTNEPYDDRMRREDPTLLKELVDMHVKELGYPLSALSRKLGMFQDEFMATYGIGQLFRVVE